MKRTLAQRMAAAVQESRLSVRKIAEMAKTSPGQVSQWQTEGKVQAENVKADVLERISRVLGVRPRWLLYGEEPMRGEHTLAIAEVLLPETDPGYVRFELFEGAAGMGKGIVNQDYPEVVKTIEVAEWEVRRKLGFLPQPGRIQLITGRGRSMQPKLEDGDVVWIDTSCDYFDGDDYYLINISGETQIKMLQTRGDGLYVVSVNTDFPAYRVDPGDVAVLGKALIHAGLRKF